MITMYAGLEQTDGQMDGWTLWQ